MLEDDLSVTALLHAYGALACWDYATAAPYVNIDLNPKVGSRFLIPGFTGSEHGYLVRYLLTSTVTLYRLVDKFCYFSQM